jgi:hypothetical protein
MTQHTDDEIIARLRDVEVPEPSPLFWDHLSQRVREAVAAEPEPAPGWSSRFNMAWGGGIFGALAVIVLAVVITTRQVPQTLIPAPVVSDVAGVSFVLPPLEDDPSWALMGDLASQMDFDEAGAAGLVVAPGAAEGALNQLSQDEQRAVVELLQQEIKNSKSL